MHLKHFAGADPKGQIWTYDAETGVARSATPENTAVIGDFYSIERPDGTMDTSIEELLSGVEDAAIPAYERLLAGEVPKSPGERANFAMFLAFMYVRTTAMRRMGGELYGRYIQILSYAYGCNPKAFEKLVAGYEKEKGVTLDADERQLMRQHLIDPTGFVFQVPKEQTLLAIGATNELTEILYRMKWSLTRPLHGFFVTSDNPVVRLVDPATRHPTYGDHGFKNKTAEVTFPLSPRALLVLSWQKDALDVGYFRRNRVDRLNASLAAHADRYLFAHVQDRRILRLAMSHRGSGPKVKSMGYGPKRYAKIEVLRRHIK